MSGVDFIRGEVERGLKDKYKSDYVFIYDYSVVSLGIINIVKVQMSHPTDVNLIKVSGDNEFDRLKEIINICGGIRYNYNQANPKLLSIDGGNCQAVAIYFKYLCDYNDIQCGINYTDEHMYNVINIMDKTYKIDVVNKSIEEVRI